MRETYEIYDRAHPFRFWQPLTNALLHNPHSIIGFLLHLGGNMLFLIVFGSRVNAIIGNLATAIIYPLLAIAASIVYLATIPSDQFSHAIGASGAINGLAGMYLILFPAHRVYCGMWFRFGWRSFAMKVFALRGFWILLIYFVYDIAMVAFGFQGNTAHWAHIGGFVAGVVIAVALLFSRKINCRNGDLLSVLLGRHAWALIGKPSQWAKAG